MLALGSSLNVKTEAARKGRYVKAGLALGSSVSCLHFRRKDLNTFLNVKSNQIKSFKKRTLHASD